MIAGLLCLAAALCITISNVSQDVSGGEASEAALTEVKAQIAEAHAEKVAVVKSVEQELAVKGKDESTVEDYVIPEYELNPRKEMPTMIVDEYGYIGVLSIPSLEIELPVLSEWSYPNLEVAPCRFSGSLYLNNMVIAAHNYQSHFGSLKELDYRETLTFTDGYGNVFTYQVIEVETLQPTEVEAMTSGDWDLTLFTCTVGGLTRVAVRCELIDSTQSGMIAE